MPKTRNALLGLIVLCITLLCSLWLVKDSLCEFQYQKGDLNVLVHFVVYETAVR